MIILPAKFLLKTDLVFDVNDKLLGLKGVDWYLVLVQNGSLKTAQAGFIEDFPGQIFFEDRQTDRQTDRPIKWVIEATSHRLKFDIVKFFLHRIDIENFRPSARKIKCLLTGKS